MQIGMVGLGKMGLNMARRLTQGGHSVVAFSVDRDAYGEAAEAGVQTCDSLADLVQTLEAPRAVWMMVPSGTATDQVSGELSEVTRCP